MSSLNVEFAGLKLRNPVIVASSPATETIDGISKCAKFGAGAVVTKSIADYQIGSYPEGSRRTYIDSRGFWATSTFRRETLTLEKGKKLISRSLQAARIPIFASVTALDFNPESWYPTCYALQEAGASLIQLDLFYLPQPICSERNRLALAELVRHLTHNIKIPVAPKLNIEIPASFVKEMFANTGIAGIFLLDSVRVSPPLLLERNGLHAYQFVKNPGESSLFGSWQMPLTLHYTYLLSRDISLPLCSGGGLMNSVDAVEVIMCGATTVQLATAILLHGYDQIRAIVSGIEEYLNRNRIDDITELRGAALQHVNKDNKTDFLPVYVELNGSLCTQCGRCLQASFCAALTMIDGNICISKSQCDGCGLCIQLCPTGALQAKVA